MQEVTQVQTRLETHGDTTRTRTHASCPGISLSLESRPPIVGCEEAWGRGPHRSMARRCWRS